jgi:opacity protein-like surface antigen
MKKLALLTFILFLGISSANAQSIRLGAKIGANFSDLNSTTATGGNQTGFHVGGLLELRALENLALQAELLYSTQGSKNYKLDYLSLPVLLKFYVTTEKLSFELGPQFSVLVNDDLDSSFDSKTADLATVVGLGYNLTDMIFVQARYIYGMSEISKNAEFKNRVVQLSAGLRF